MADGMRPKETIYLLVTLDGEQASVEINQVALDADNRITHKYRLVLGRSFSDVERCITAAALRSQGREP